MAYNFLNPKSDKHYFKWTFIQFWLTFFCIQLIHLIRFVVYILHRMLCAVIVNIFSQIKNCSYQIRIMFLFNFCKQFSALQIVLDYKESINFIYTVCWYEFLFPFFFFQSHDNLCIRFTQRKKFKKIVLKIRCDLNWIVWISHLLNSIRIEITTMHTIHMNKKKQTKQIKPENSNPLGELNEWMNEWRNAQMHADLVRISFLQ